MTRPTRPLPPNMTFIGVKHLMLFIGCAFGIAFAISALTPTPQIKEDDPEVVADIESGSVPASPESDDESRARSKSVSQASKNGSAREAVPSLAETLLAVRADRFIARGERHLVAVNQLAAGLEEWKTELDAVMTDDRGRQLATVPENAEFYVGIQSRVWPTLEQLQEWEHAFDSLISRLKTAKSASDSSEHISDSYEQEIDDIGRDVRHNLNELARLRKSHELRLKSVSDVRLPLDSPSLEVALTQWQDKQQSERNAIVKKAIEEVKEEERNKLIAATKESQRPIEQLERERVQLEQADKAQKQRDDNAKTEEKARLEAEERLRRRQMQSQMADIRRYLVPFISQGNRQVNGGQQWVYTDKAVGMSLSALKAVKALQNDRDGYEMFLFVAGGPYNDRPNGVFRETIGGAAMETDIPDIRKAQVLLEEFGDLLVEDGLLSP